MRKLSLFTFILFIAGLTASANNIESIYGKNDLNLSNSYNYLYGNNFGSILEFDQMPTRYIDIDYGRSEIASINSENENFAREIQNYLTEIESDRVRKSDIVQLLNKIDLLLVDLKSTSAELYTLKTSLTDIAMRRKLQKAIEQNRQQIYDLNNKKESMYSSLEELNNKIEASERFVTVNNLYIRRNTGEINYLQECIDYSSRDTSSLDTAVEKSISYQSKVDDIINVSF